MAMTRLIDPTVAGKYPVIFGDGLLDGTSDGIFTGIRYNHKPTLSSDEAPNNARLKPSIPGKTDSYDLSFTDDDGAYAYTGSRSTNSNQYVLHFDHERKAFILDRIDSTFNMNITRIPENADSDRLRSQYAQLDSRPSPLKRTTAKKPASSKETAPSKSQSQAKEAKRKTEKQPTQQVAKEVALSFPEPQKDKAPKPKTPSQSFDDEDEDDDDDDGGLLIEYPGGDTAKQADFSPAFPPPRRFDDFMDQRDSGAEDADGESDDEPYMDFKLPSPVNNHLGSSKAVSATVDPATVAGSVANHHHDAAAEVQRDEEDDMNDMEDDLEKDMEMAFEDMANTPDGDESEISEED